MIIKWLLLKTVKVILHANRVLHVYKESYIEETNIPDT